MPIVIIFQAQQAEELLIEAISAGITHDMGSGSNVDICCITKGNVDFKRNVKIGASRVKPPLVYDFPLDNTRNFACFCGLIVGQLFWVSVKLNLVVRVIRSRSKKEETKWKLNQINDESPRCKIQEFKKNIKFNFLIILN